MKFKITSGLGIAGVRDVVLLDSDEWDDYGYKTTFHASYYDLQGVPHELGTVKIAKKGMHFSGRISACLSSEFEVLEEGFFSLWQTAEAYKRVVKWQARCNYNILNALNDISYNTDIYEKYKDEKVLQKSLFRFVPYSVYHRQFRRIARGEAMLTPYHFSYIVKNSNSMIEDCVLQFSVEPLSLPPTNVHAIIGSNGIGKTTLIKRMIKSICKKDDKNGRFDYAEIHDDESGIFENIIGISFNPFDDYSEIEDCDERFKYIGIRKEYNSEGYEDGYSEINLLDDITTNFIVSLKKCLIDVTKKDDLREVLGMLESECNFLSINYEFDLKDDILKQNKIYLIEKFFNQLSAGHKLVLSIITRCIDELVEKSIVFIDEPENHLHPPLLSSLVRGISKMLVKRNGVAIVSTHSPIVLQEIPRSCVWILNRVGETINARRPEIETFGTNIGVLTNEIFGFEVKRTGFTTLLKDAVDKYNDYERILEKFDYKLGDEAKSILRILIKQKEMQ